MLCMGPLFMKRGQTMTDIRSNFVGADKVVRFHKAESGYKHLYFYVGEAEQNADLINVGNMAENFATISGKLNEIGTSAEYMSTVETQVNEMSTVVNTFDTKMASVDEHVAELTTTVEGMADVQTQMGELSAQMDEVTANIETQQAEMTTKLNEVNEIAENMTTFTKRYLIDSYVNGTDWYNLYNDGWLEQGGIIPASATTITLLKAYSSDIYSILMAGANYAASDQTLGVSSHDSTSFKVSSSSYKRFWEAKGYTTLPTEQEPTDTPTEE